MQRQDGYPAKMNENEMSASAKEAVTRNPTELPLLKSHDGDKKETQSEKQRVDGDGHLPRVKHPTSYIETLINLVKGNSGAGMFAMGDAYKNGGLLVAPILTIFLGVICVFGNHILVNACKTIRVRKKLDHLPSFSETIQYCFEEGPDSIRSFAVTARKLTFLFITITQLGFCSVYFLFVSSTFKKVLEPHGIVIDVHIYMAIILIPILLTALIGTLKFLTPFSFIANVCLMSGVVLTLYISAQDLPPLSSRPAAVSLSQLPLFFGTTIYSFEGISLVLPLQNEMKKPKYFDKPLGVLNVGMTIICGVLCSIGFIGFLKYGDDVKGSLTLNLPPNERFSEIVQLVISVGILLSYTLQFYVAAQIIWPLVNNKFGPFKKPMVAEKFCRALIVLFTFTLAESVPNIGLFISLVGAVCGTTLALIFPPICDLVLRWPSNFGVLKWRLVLDVFSLIVAAIGLTTGCFYSTKAIVEIYWKQS